MKKIFLFLAAIGFSNSALAWTECTFTPEHVWLGLDAENVWVKFEEGNWIFKTSDETTDRQLNSILSMTMAAITSDRSIVVRYTDDNVVCTDLDGDKTSDFMGISFK
ncbi:hypothetical protein ACJJIW_00365 [Microbulbifer sp. JMSA004]|uniref:hypothetical protein n=1 Tax=Microbulbifer sp. JMSA004 TaxID=3243370 RepID=UPI00403A4A14